MLVGNKLDLEAKREVAVEDGAKLAKELKITHVETSAKEGKNFDSLFNYITSILPGLEKAKIMNKDDLLKKGTKIMLTREAPSKSLCCL